MGTIDIGTDTHYAIALKYVECVTFNGAATVPGGAGCNLLQLPTPLIICGDRCAQIALEAKTMQEVCRNPLSAT